ncbi:MAG: methyltransferase domain-containing protein [Jatrophihabitans sp.]|uniref:class I SAM-dependent methyltransferase n=1 Tax=Jatrophihabitans sp. TaxID=1932789 RepID=UPI003F813D58
MARRARYGIDGFPSLLGFAGLSTALGAAAATVLRHHRVTRAAALTAAGAAAVPAVRGSHYVVHGKRALRDRLLDAVTWHGDEDVADLGAGAGLLGIGAARRTTGTVHCVDLFVAKDLSGNRPERLLTNAQLEGVRDRVVVHREDVRRTTLADHSVDVVLSVLCLHNLGEPGARAQALTEIARILRPGGTVVISDLAHVEAEYAPALRRLGLEVELRGGARGTFPPQRWLVARSPAPQPV